MSSFSGNFGDRILKQLEDLITELGGLVPPKPSPFNVDERILQLQNAFRLVAGSGLVVATANFRTAAECVDSFFFVANRSLRVVRLEYIHSVSASNSTFCSPRICRGSPSHDPPLLGSELPDLVFNCQSSANVNVSVTYPNPPSAFYLAKTVLNAGDRLSATFNNPPVQLVGVCLTAYMVPYRV
jgi:hypothetical protein